MLVIRWSCSVGISGPNLRRGIKSSDIGEDGSKKSEGSDATVICSLEVCPLEDAAATLCCQAGCCVIHCCPSQNKHTYSRVQKTRNLNCTVGGNVNGTTMLENEMEVP